MPPNDGDFESPTREIEQRENRRIYICETGGVRIEERHFRRTFSPEEFVALLRRIFQTIDARADTNGKKYLF